MRKRKNETELQLQEAPPVQEAGNPEPAEAERRKAFEDLINGEYQDLYTEKFQQVFNRRFKEMRRMEQLLNAQKPVIDLLMQRYNIPDGDLNKLRAAIQQDSASWQSAAEQAGMGVEQYRMMRRLEQENARLRQMQNQQQRQLMARQRVARWEQEARDLQDLYPDFDFRTESQNRKFRELLQSGLSVQKAYELTHLDEIKAAAARTAGEQAVAKLQNKAARPLENGTSAQGAVIVKNDVSNLSREERAELARRAQRGETIRF